MNEKVCRLCLQTICENYRKIAESQKKLLKLNMSMSEENVMCMECTNNLQVFLNLKTVCAENTKNQMSCTVPQDEIRCSFCTSLIAKEIISLHESKESIFLLDTLGNYIPELNLSSTEEHLICETCLDRMQCISRFLNNCSYVEEELHKYSEIKEMVGKGQIELQNLQQLIMKPTLKFEDAACHINHLGQTYDHIQETYTMKIEAKDEVKCEIEEYGLESIVKIEDVDIKSEHNDCDGFQETAGSTMFDIPLGVPLNDYEMCSYEAKHRGGIKRHILTTTANLKDRVGDHIITHQSHSNIKMFKCEICGFETRYKGNLPKHALTHKGATVLKCDLCTFEVKYKRDLKSHVLLAHKNSSDRTLYTCKTCAFETKYKQSLILHKLTHKSPSELSMFKCDMCTFETKRKDSLKGHMLVHKNSSEINTFLCEMCSFQTKHKRTLNQHVLIIHKTTSESMLKCESCTFETKYKRSLTQHQLTHKSPSEIAMFKCEMCSFETKYKFGLTNHMLLHKSPSEITRFKCKICRFETKRKANLKDHILRHNDPSERTMFKCGLCTFETKCKSYLSKHRKRNHILKGNMVTLKACIGEQTNIVPHLLG